MAELKPRVYTFLREKGPLTKAPGDWPWAKKLITDLNKRDSQLTNLIRELQNRQIIQEIIDRTVTNNTTVENSAAGVVTVLVTDPLSTQDMTVLEGICYYPIDSKLHGKHLTRVSAMVSVAPTGGDLTVMLVRVRPSMANVDLLSQIITIQQGKKFSEESAPQPIIDPGLVEAQLLDQVFIGVRAVGTGARGLTVTSVYEEPTDG